MPRCVLAWCPAALTRVWLVEGKRGSFWAVCTTTPVIVKPELRGEARTRGETGRLASSTGQGGLAWGLREVHVAGMATGTEASS